jgi:transcriptional regulator of acetoin/glycerol metabolism
LLIVRQNQFATFARLAQVFADEPNVRLIWDRRTRERRERSSSSSSERRRLDRRGEESATWARKDYLLLRVGEGVTGPDAAASLGTRERKANEHIDLDIEVAVGSDLAVLISGGEPVSRGALARRIHRESRGLDAPFTILSPQTLGRLSTPALDRRLAPNTTDPIAGTLLIEEIGDWSLSEQTALMEFLEMTSRRADTAIAARSTRLISGTDYWLLDLVATKQFREDLFYRLNVIHLVLPSGASR